SEGKLGGGIAMTEVMDKLVPAMTMAINGQIALDCEGSYPDCCADLESNGAQALDFFNDEDSMDCVVSDDELSMNSIIASTLLNPDLDLLDGDGNPAPAGDGVNDSLSLGVGFTGVGATFARP